MAARFFSTFWIGFELSPILIVSIEQKMKSSIKLPQDVTLLQEMVRELLKTVTEQGRHIDHLEHRMERLLRARYGPRSERADANELLLFEMSLLEKEEESNREPEEESVDPPPRKKRKGHGRRRLPAHLMRKRIEHDLSEEEKLCPCCGKPRVRIGEEWSEQLEYIPASFLVLLHVRYKYACSNCDTGVVTADKPSQPIEKGLPGPGLLAHVITNKYSDHLPLHRQEDILARHGVEIPRSTQWGWIAQVVKLLEPLYERMKAEVLKSKVVQTDDTPMPVLDKDRTSTRRGHIWVYRGDRHHPFTVFDFTPNRTRAGPQRFLSGYKGHLQADAYPGYDGLFAQGDIVELACFAHARRKYDEAKTSDPARAHEALVRIGRLYKVEKDARNLSPETRQRVREDRARPLLDSLKEWLEILRNRVLPKSPMGKAIHYSLSNWEALQRYVNDGDFEIDNNAAERALRGVVLGRKNYLFTASDNGGRAAAVLYSFTRTCKRHRIDPFVYLRDILSRIADHSVPHLSELLPDAWKKARDEEAGGLLADQTAG